MPILSEDQVVQQYDDFLASHPNVKFVLIGQLCCKTCAEWMIIEYNIAGKRFMGLLVWKYTQLYR